MIIYEVNLTIDKAIAAEYRAWLDGHIKEILALPGFSGARLCVPEGDAGTESVLLTIAYELKSRQDLDDYLTNHAPRLRKDAIERFGDKFSATRRILAVEKAYPA